MCVREFVQQRQQIWWPIIISHQHFDRLLGMMRIAACVTRCRQVQGIPQLTILAPDSTVLSANARSAVRSSRHSCMQGWLPRQSGALQEPPARARLVISLVTCAALHAVLCRWAWTLTAKSSPGQVPRKQGARRMHDTQLRCVRALLACVVARKQHANTVCCTVLPMPAALHHVVCCIMSLSCCTAAASPCPGCC